MKVLIADDSKLVRQRVKKILASNDEIEKFIEASNVAEAVSCLSIGNPDVVILDIEMPDGTGLDLLKEIKKMDYRPVVIILTNHSYPGYRAQCLADGASFFLDKSIEFLRVRDVFEGLKYNFNQ